MISRKTRWSVDEVEYLRRLGAKIREEEKRNNMRKSKKRAEEAEG